MGDNANNNNSGTIKHSDDRGTVIVGELNSRKQVFNIQSSGTKPYDTSNMLKPSGSNDQSKNEWGDSNKGILIVVKKYPLSPAILFAGILGSYIIFIS